MFRHQHSYASKLTEWESHEQGIGIVSLSFFVASQNTIISYNDNNNKDIIDATKLILAIVYDHNSLDSNCGLHITIKLCTFAWQMRMMIMESIVVVFFIWFCG